MQAFTSFEPRTHRSRRARAVLRTVVHIRSGNDARPDGKTTPLSEEGESAVSTRWLRVFASILGNSDIVPDMGASEFAACSSYSAAPIDDRDVGGKARREKR